MYILNTSRSALKPSQDKEDRLLRTREREREREPDVLIYIYTVREYPYIHSVFVRDAIFPHCTLVHIARHVASHPCSSEKTSKTERLNPQGNQRNRDLKTVR